MRIDQYFGAQCSKCGVEGTDSCDLLVLRFEELEGAPELCARCVYQGLSGDLRGFRERVRPYIRERKDVP